MQGLSLFISKNHEFVNAVQNCAGKISATFRKPIVSHDASKISPHTLFVKIVYN